MVDEFTDRLAGRRARTRVDGETVTGTVTSVTYTPKRGDVVLALELDEPTAAGRDAVAVGLEDVEPL